MDEKLDIVAFINLRLDPIKKFVFGTLNAYPIETAMSLAPKLPISFPCSSAAIKVP